MRLLFFLAMVLFFIGLGWALEGQAVFTGGLLLISLVVAALVGLLAAATSTA